MEGSIREKGAGLGSSPARWLVVLLLVAINGAVLWNALRHDVRIAYDADDHLSYVEVLAEGRLPDRRESNQSYAPPLPYAFPALVRAATGVDAQIATRAALVLQAALSLGTCFLLLGLCRRLRPGDATLAITALLLLGMPAVYYRTFAFLRGEPYLVFFGALSTLLAFDLLDGRGRSRGRTIALGVVWALLALSRQWGLIIVGGTFGFLFLRSLARRAEARVILAPAAAALGIALLAAVPFYARSLLAPSKSFNVKMCATCKKPVGLEKAQWGIGWPYLVQRPVRPAMRSEPLGVLYADWWGDYHVYFLFHGARAEPGAACFDGASFSSYLLYGRPRDATTNIAEMAPYLSRINLLAAVPTLLLLGGFLAGLLTLLRTLPWREADDHSERVGLLATLVLGTLAGHLAMLVLVGLGGLGRDALKATYDLQLLPAAALLGADLLSRATSGRPRWAGLCLAVLLGIAAYGYGSAFTRWPLPQTCDVLVWGRASEREATGGGPLRRRTPSPY
jgi:hypothetical protein